MGAIFENPMGPGGSQASAGQGVDPCNIGFGSGIRYHNQTEPESLEAGLFTVISQALSDRGSVW